MQTILPTLASDDALALARARALLAVYGEQWTAKWNDYRVLGVEQEFEFSLVNPETNAASRTFNEAGKIDVVVEHRTTGAVFIVEHKTTSDSVEPDSDYWDRLRMDNQCSKYFLWAAQGGLEPSGIIYDVIRKPMHKPSLVPDLDENGLKIVVDQNGQRVFNKTGGPRQTADTEKGYTIQGHIETPAEFETRLLSVLREQPALHFAQRVVPRLDSDILEYASDAWAMSQQILYARAHNLWPRNPGACSQFGKCEYFDLCCGRESVDSIRYRKRDTVHSELTIQSTKELLTNSRATALRKCSRYHKLRYEDGIESVHEDKEALKLGTLVHLGLEAYFRKLQTTHN